MQRLEGSSRIEQDCNAWKLHAAIQGRGQEPRLRADALCGDNDVALEPERQSHISSWRHSFAFLLEDI